MESEQTSVLRPLILVAEDDDSNFKLIKAIIGKKCDIEWAKNGEEMVQLFQEHQHKYLFYHCKSGKYLLMVVRRILKVIGFTNTSVAPAFIAFSLSELKA